MFEPIGDRPRWAVALDELRKASVGDVVTYETLGRALDTKNRDVIQSAARQAGGRLLSEDLNAIEAVPNKGYRIVEPEEHVRLARSQEKRSRRALSRGRDTAQHVDMNGLSEESKRIILATAEGFSRVLDMMKQTERAVAMIGRAQAALEVRVDSGLSDNAERLARLEAQVAALGEAAE